jgi:hypothetical protein
LGPENDLLLLELKNSSEAPIKDQLTVNVEQGPELTGHVSITPNSESQVWLDTPESIPPILNVTINSSIGNRMKNQVTDHLSLGLKRQFDNSEGKEVEPAQLPLGSKFRESIKIKNNTSKKLTSATIKSSNDFDLPDLSVGENVTLSRWVTLPAMDASIPELTLCHSEEQIELPSQNISQKKQFVQISSAICDTSQGFTLLLEVSCANADRTESFRLESLTLQGQDLLSITDVDQQFAAGEVHRRKIPIAMDSPAQWLNHGVTQTITATFSKAKGKDSADSLYNGIEYKRSTLAPVTDDEIPPQISANIKTVGRGFFQKYTELSLETTEDGNQWVIVYIKDANGQTLESKKCNLAGGAGIEFEPSSRMVRVSVEGTGGSALDNSYVFKQYNSGWELVDRTEQVPLPTSAVTTDWELTGGGSQDGR